MYDNVFIDEVEISNLRYLEFLFYIKRDSTDEYSKAQKPDTSLYDKMFNIEYKSGYIDNYLRYPGFRYFPVLGVSHEQAKEFCKWRSEFETKLYQSEEFKKKHPSLKDYDVSVIYRLPTVEEWEYGASGGYNVDSFPFGVKYPFEGKGLYTKYTDFESKKYLDTVNFKYEKNTKIYDIGFHVKESWYSELENRFIADSLNTLRIFSSPPQIPSYIYKFMPNGFGVYGMIGNVSEMTSTKGIAKGGSHFDSIKDISIKKNISYIGLSSDLGFRCVAEVHIRKKQKNH